LATQLETTVWSVPFLYDLPKFSNAVQELKQRDDFLVVLAPLAPRALSVLTQQLLQRSEPPVCFDSRSLDVDKFCQEVRALQQQGLTQGLTQSLILGDVSGGKVEWFDESTVERWYPLLDAKRCLACLECVNFCLFGVYAIGQNDKPFVDQPDACRDGCPACSRVCPAKAIIFPLYDDPEINGTADPNADTNKPAGDLDELVDAVDEL
jgi:NAD-dependent dihydropyrimidine dehydrogenase PreA subunit